MLSLIQNREVLPMEENKVTNLKTAPKTPKLNTSQQKLMDEAKDALMLSAATAVAFFFRQLGFTMSKVIEQNTNEEK